MKVVVRVDGVESPLLVEVRRDGAVLVDGEAMTLTVRDLGGGRRLVGSASGSQVVDVLKLKGETEVHVDGHTLRLQVQDERDTWLGAADAAHRGGAITVAMPGRVVAVDVSVGDAVKRGDRLLVIEAMKMENPVRAPRDGTVSAIHVTKGAAVESAQPLLEIA